MNEERYFWAITALQIGSVIALIRMGTEHHAVCRGDFGHRASWVQLLALLVSLLAQAVGTYVIRSMR